ncbi:hypothetical protein FOTG_16978 [Fusarium oxysporum f. sp. vasinfectum 25433]|uniref:Uncharacterized protein n=2 Tax=Fusarium oxysporum TaxID=5507 RepID=X0L139_FUSOX|nr:hypothetical protein FOTG_16978 [Fusarium oxysporum f. sp. vasinfectum 25433]
MGLLMHDNVLEPRTPHKSSLRNGRHSKTQSIYVSLKTHMNDILGTSREKHSAYIIDSRFPGSVPRYDTQYSLLEHSTPSNNDVNLHSNSSSPPVKSTKQSFRSPICLARKIGRQIGGFRSGSVRYPATTSEPLGEDITHGQRHGVEIETRTVLDNRKLNPFSKSRNTRCLESRYSGTEPLLCDPQASRHPRRGDSPPEEERHHVDIAQDKSYFYTSSQSDSESVRQFSHQWMISKINNALDQLRDAFSLDEHERAFFKSRRSMPIDSTPKQYSMSVFIDGRRVARNC